jgi:hypothetical protein
MQCVHDFLFILSLKLRNFYFIFLLAEDDGYLVVSIVDIEVSAIELVVIVVNEEVNPLKGRI